MKLTNSKIGGGGHLINNAFTLIELLAVIIILAIVALIATPIILDVVEDARISAGKSESQMIYSGINNYCETIKLKKQMGTLTSEDVDCESKTTFTTEEISKMVNLGNSKVLENTYNGTLTYLKVESNGHIFILENGKFVEEGEIAFTPGECFTYEDITLVESFDINYDACVTYMNNSNNSVEICNGQDEDGYTLKDKINLGSFELNDLKNNNVLSNVVKINGIEITGYDNTCGGMDVVMPASIDGKSIVSIGETAFGEYSIVSYNFNSNQEMLVNNILRPELKKIYSIDLSNVQNLKIIKNNAFSNNWLTNVTIPNSVTTIGEYAFEYNQLTSITIPDSVTTIRNNAFRGNQLTSITIPNSVTTIRDYAFYGNQLTNVTIPDSVTTIGNNAFSENQLTSVIIPNSVTTIRDGAFSENQLTSVAIPDSVTTISFSAFSNNQLTSVTIPNSVTEIGRNAFRGNQLTSITIPNSVTTIGDSAFSDNQLTSVTIPDSVTTIDDNAFGDNELTSVTIPNSVTTIGRGTFRKSSTSNLNLTTIINQTGKVFDWGQIVNGGYSTTSYNFETGTVVNSAGNVEITK